MLIDSNTVFEEFCLRKWQLYSAMYFKSLYSQYDRQLMELDVMMERFYNMRYLIATDNHV